MRKQLLRDMTYRLWSTMFLITRDGQTTKDRGRDLRDSPMNTPSVGFSIPIHSCGYVHRMDRPRTTSSHLNSVKSSTNLYAVQPRSMGGHFTDFFFLLYQMAKQLVKSIYHGTLIVGCDHPALEVSRALLAYIDISIVSTFKSTLHELIPP